MYNEYTINRLSTEDILYAVNILDRSPYLGFKYDYAKLLGSIKRNSTGHIISATAALYNFNTVVDLTKVKNESFNVANSSPRKTLDEENIRWQDQAIEAALRANERSTVSGKIFCTHVTIL